jgi:phage regulator Rha-like protein
MFESSVSFIVAIEGNGYMSSLQIAELCAKQHKNVLVDCEALKEFYGKKYESNTPEISGVLIKSSTYKASNGKSNKCFLLSRDAVLDLITGYSIEHRHAINQAWLEYERKAKESQKPLSRIEWIQKALAIEIQLEAEREANKVLIEDEFEQD